MTIRRRKRAHNNGEQNDSDQKIIERCLAGEQAAFQELVERHQKRGISIALGYVNRNFTDAQDMVQEAFLRAYKGLNRFIPGSSFSAWFSKIVVNVCIDHYRKQKKRNSVEYDDSYKRRDVTDEHSFVGNTRDLEPHHRSEQAELHQALEVAMNKLSEKHRTIIILREVDHRSYEEIAEILDCSLGTVMSRLHHARKNYQEALRPYLKSIGEYQLAALAGEGVGTKRTAKNDHQTTEMES